MEGHLVAVPGLAVEQGPTRDLHSQHLLQADRLSAELHLIRPVPLGRAALVFDRKGPPPPRPVPYPRTNRRSLLRAMKLDHIGPSAHAEGEASKGHVTTSPNLDARFGLPGDNLVVEVLALDGPHVVEPDLLEMDEGCLALAEDEVLEAGERKEIGFGDACRRWARTSQAHEISSRTDTPAGIAAESIEMS
jgi:hypothetical protein